jgi:hypothetical protein
LTFSVTGKIIENQGCFLIVGKQSLSTRKEDGAIAVKEEDPPG